VVVTSADAPIVLEELSGVRERPMIILSVANSQLALQTLLKELAVL